MQGLAKRRAIAEFRIGRHRRHLDPRGAHLLQQRQRLPPLLLEPHARRNAAAIALSRRRHPSGKYSCAPTSHACTPVHSAAVTATWQLPILPERARVLPLHADRRVPLLGKARAIEHEHARPGGNRGAQLPPQAPRASHVASVMKYWRP